jgi:hypothetical protein
MIGGFPDENQVIDLIAKGEWAQVKLVNNVYYNKINKKISKRKDLFLFLFEKCLYLIFNKFRC